MREPSVTSQLRYPDDIRTIFMQVCTFSRGACFGLGEREMIQNMSFSTIQCVWRFNKLKFIKLGENMLHRRIVAITPVRCFLIPRYWLLEHNRANIWGRVKQFMDSKYPTKKQLFNEFLLNRKYDNLHQTSLSLIFLFLLIINSDLDKNYCYYSGFHFRWMSYKQNLVEDVVKRHGRYRSSTTIHDVPYSIRITDEIDPKI